MHLTETWSTAEILTPTPCLLISDGLQPQNFFNQLFISLVIIPQQRMKTHINMMTLALNQSHHQKHDLILLLL